MDAHPRVIRWETLNKKSFDTLDRARCIVVVTCSPLEVHGPHLPIGADVLEGEGLAERALRFLPERPRSRTVLKLPCVYAATDVVPQPGSLFFRPATTMAVLEDLGRTLAAQGFRDVVVSNFHGSPRHFLALEAACQRVSRRHRIRMVSVFSMMLARFTTGPETLEDVLASFSGVDRSQLAGDTHGGLLETSQLLALHGEWVDPDYKQLPRLTFESWLARAQSGRAREPQGRIRGLLALLRSFRGNVRFFETNSYAGAPAGASAELGERILDALGERSAAALAEVFDGTLSPLECHSPLWRWRFFFLHPWLIRLANRVVGFRNVLA